MSLDRSGLRDALPLTAAERRQASDDLMLADPRWILPVALFGRPLVAVHLQASRHGSPDVSTSGRGRGTEAPG